MERGKRTKTCAYFLWNKRALHFPANFFPELFHPEKHTSRRGNHCCIDEERTDHRLCSLGRNTAFLNQTPQFFSAHEYALAGRSLLGKTRFIWEKMFRLCSSFRHRKYIFTTVALKKALFRWWEKNREGLERTLLKIVIALL